MPVLGRKKWSRNGPTLKSNIFRILLPLKKNAKFYFEYFDQIHALTTIEDNSVVNVVVSFVGFTIIVNLLFQAVSIVSLTNLNSSSHFSVSLVSPYIDF